MNANTPTTHDLDRFRELLHALASRLAGDITQLTDEATRPTGAEGTAAEEPAHDPTAAGNVADEEVARSVLMSEEQILAETRAALARLDAGTFGRCEGCGRAITKPRLEAVPYARHCIACAGGRTQRNGLTTNHRTGGPTATRGRPVPTTPRVAGDSAMYDAVGLQAWEIVVASGLCAAGALAVSSMIGLPVAYYFTRERPVAAPAVEPRVQPTTERQPVYAQSPSPVGG